MTGPQATELRQRVAGWFPMRVAVRYVAISGYDRALALATQGFVALVPMLIVVASALPSGSKAAAEGLVIDRIRLSGSAAADVQELLQRTYQAAWDLPTLGLWGYVRALLGAAALIGEIILFILVGLVLEGFPGAELLAALARLVLCVLLWWPVQRLLLGNRVGWRQLLPGAVIAGVGQVLVLTLSGIYLQLAIESQAQRYGLIGVAFVLVSWMIVLGLLLVLAAVLGALLGGPLSGADRVRSGDPG